MLATPKAATATIAQAAGRFRARTSCNTGPPFLMDSIDRSGPSARAQALPPRTNMSEDASVNSQNGGLPTSLGL